MKLFSTLFLLCFLAMNTQAQMAVCMPDTTNLDSIMVVRPQPFDEEDNPDGGIDECAVIGEPYEFVFTIKIDSSYTLGGTTIDVDSLTVNDIVGLPEGITYECSTENCTFEKNSVGCIVLQGTPETNNPIMGYSLEIQGTIFTPFIPIDATFPDPNIAPGEYILNLVANREDMACMTTATDNPLAQQLDLQNQPNPFSGVTTIAVNATEAGDFTFAVRDLLGQQIHQREVRLQNGQNAFEFDANDLPKGLYLYSISDGVNVVSKKMMVQ